MLHILARQRTTVNPPIPMKIIWVMIRTLDDSECKNVTVYKILGRGGGGIHLFLFPQSFDH